MHNAFDAGAGMGLGLIAVFFYVSFFAAIIGFGIWIWWRILKKAGLPPPLSILMIIPIVSFVMKIILAFTEWPIEKQLRETKSSLPKSSG